jgi:hypothetical protein
MYPVSLSISDSLGIHLDRESYVPGDTITGHVFRKTPIVCPYSTIQLCVHGDARSRWGVSKSDFQLLYFEDHHTILHKGPLHIESGSEGARWHFSITLPHRVDPITGRRYGYVYDIPAESRPELPASYKFQGYGEVDAFVQYHVKVTLYHKSHGGAEEVGAVHPFTIERFHPGPPLVEFAVERWRYHRGVTSRLLIPGVNDVKLSLRQSFKQSFTMPKDPEFKFDFYVELPMAIQLDGPAPIPFRMLVSPNWGETSEIIRGVQQEVKLMSIQCWVVTHTQFILGKSSSVDKTAETDLGLIHAINDLNTTIRIPCTTAWRPVDIGEMVNLRIGTGTGFPRDDTQPKLTPNFCTFNIKVKHKLKWAVKCDIQGERFWAEGISDLFINMPSGGRVAGSGSPESIDSPAVEVPESVQTRDESWIRPPDEEGPPTFFEVQRENQLAGRSGA